MTETVATEKAPKRRNGRGPARASASALAAHLDVTRQYIAKLTADAVIEKRGGGYDQDVCRLRYLAHLRSGNRRSPRSAADAAHATAKAEMLQIRIAKEKGELMAVSEVEDFTASLIGLLLARLSGFPIRCGGRDLAVRREIESAVYDLRLEISEAASELARGCKPSRI